MINNPELLAAYKRGEKKAFLELYNKYSSPLKKFLQGGFSFSSQGRICRFRGADPSMEVDSLVQETFTRAFVATTRTNYDGERPFQTYLFSIAKNLVLRECHQRERLVHVESIEDTIQPTVNYPFCSRESYGQNPEQNVQNLQLKKMTEQFIDELNDEEQAFFTSRFANGLTQEATASEMNTTRARIKLLEKNMRKRFLDMMRKNGYLIDHELAPRWKRKAGLAQAVA
jgi:RNA polymerase sigma factor (sigma-70 family)